MREISILKERILQYADKMGITKYEIYQKTGISNGVFSQKGGLSEENILKFLSYYKDISPKWLLTGKGSMLIGEQQIVPYSDPNEALQDENIKQIPIIDIEVAAGSGMLNSDYIEPLGHISVPSNSLSSRTAMYYGIRSRGESMFPTIYDKDLLIIRQLDRGEWVDLRDEYVYIIVDRTGRSYVKRIKNRLSRGFIVLTSDNLDKVNYPNFSLEENELHFFFYPELRISPHFPNINATYFDRLKHLEDRVDDLDYKLKKLQ